MATSPFSSGGSSSGIWSVIIIVTYIHGEFSSTGFLRRAVRAGPGAAAGGESQLAGAGARRAWWGFRHVSDVGTTWGPRPAHATAHSGVEAPAVF